MSLVATLLNAYQAPYVNMGIDKFNNLHPMQPYGFWASFAADTNATLRGIENSINREGQPQVKGVEIPVLGTNPGVVSTNHPDCEIVASQSTSAVVSPTYVPATISAKVPSIAELRDVNQMQYMQVVNHEFNWAMYELARELDNRARIAADTARTQVFGDELSMTFNAVDDQLEIPSTLRSEWLNELVSSLNLSGFGNDMYVIGNSGVDATFNKMRANGMQNADNTAYQFNGVNLRSSASANLTNDAGIYGTGYTASVGSLAALTALHRNSVSAMQLDENDEWGVITNTPLGVPVGYHRKRVCETSTTGASYYDLWEFTVYAAFMTAWVNDPATQQHPITKFVLQS